MFLSLFLLILFIFMSYALFDSIKHKRFELNSENMSSSFEDQPYSYIFTLLTYVGIWGFLGFLIYTRWPWL